MPWIDLYKWVKKTVILIFCVQYFSTIYDDPRNSVGNLESIFHNF